MRNRKLTVKEDTMCFTVWSFARYSKHWGGVCCKTIMNREEEKQMLGGVDYRGDEKMNRDSCFPG